MSITALILMTSLERQDKLAAEHGARIVARSIYLYAARLIAGDYSN